MSVLFAEYPKCTTCQKAKKWLDAAGVSYEDRHIKEQNPSAEELKKWHQMSGLPLKKFFNTSGMLYRELGVKDQLTDMNETEQLELLAAHPMLVKRPILVANEAVLVGFDEVKWAEVVG